MIFGRLLNKIYCKNNKYLDESGVDSYPSNHWGGIGDIKSLLSARRALKTKRRIGVDPRECWNLDTSLYEWLYSNLCQLLIDTNTDLDARKFTFKDKTYTEGELINYLKDICLDLIKFDEFEGCPEVHYEFVEVEGKEPELRSSKEIREEDRKKFMEAYEKNGKRYDSLLKDFCDVLYILLPHLWW